jgi:hypothetical protein
MVRPAQIPRKTVGQLTHFSFGRIGSESLASIWESATLDGLRARMRESYLPVCVSCCRHSALM